MVRNPPKPTYALEVGVIGNRRFGEEALREAARKAFDEVWAEIHRAFVDALQIRVPVPEHPDTKLKDFFNGDPARLAVLSNLAAGADQIGIVSALDLPRDKDRVRVQLEAILPFPEADYPMSTGKLTDDFTPDEAAKLRELCRHPCTEQVTRLDGQYWSLRNEAFDSPHNQACRHRAYRQAAELLFQNADLVVAAYNPFAEAGPAGTVENIQAALGLSVPVLAILVTPLGTRIALHLARDRQFAVPKLDWEAAQPLASGKWQEPLRRRVQYLLAIPHLLEAEGEVQGSPAAQDRAWRLAVAVQRLRLYFGDEPVHNFCISPTLAEFLEEVWRALLGLGRQFASSTSEAPPHLPLAAPSEAFPTANGDATLSRYQEHFKHASKLSRAYMRTYRGSFALAFILAGAAAAAAVALMAAALLSGGTPAPGTVLVLGGLKLAILGTLLHLEWVGRRERHQEHAADFRHLAELLRPMPWLAPFGTLVPTVEIPPHYAPLDPRQGWTNWLFRALTRAEPSVAPRPDSHASLDSSAAQVVVRSAQTEWIDLQIRYHEENGRDMHALHQGLEHLGKLLLWIVLACAGVALILELRPHPGPLHTLAVILGALAAAVPAFIAALVGIVFQAEAKRLSLRSEAMAALLKERRRKLDALPPHPLGGDAWETAQRLRSLAGIMVSETVDWRALYQLHEVKAG